jgi:1-hydroxycarotenoid 3,4-desaturase
VYLCAQDRGGTDGPPAATPERLLCVVNAPANGDREAADPAALAELEAQVFGRLGRAGLRLAGSPADGVRTTPQDFAALFPATGGALYGAASHGWRAAFRRPAPRTGLAGLYLAGGSVHPGAGVPMAALSGHLAAQAVIGDYQDP